MSIKLYDYELETSFLVNKNVFNRMLLQGIINVSQTLFITQRWIDSQELPNGIKKKERIRRTAYQGIALEDIEDLEYTVKFYLTDNKRIELNTLLSRREFNTLRKLFKDCEETFKVRRILSDKSQKGAHYMADMYKDRDLVTIEVEFDNEGYAKDWYIPDWLKIAIEETKNGKSGK